MNNKEEIQTTNSKRIATNTVILYVRMIILMIIALYTSRVVLQMLGLEDFGIYNVVAGIVEFATIFTGTMTTATQRFLSYHLGKNDIVEFNKTFSSLYNIFLISCFVLLLTMLPIGVWVVKDILVIPTERVYTALWVLIASVISFVLSTITIPYMSAIISYERMDMFAYISIAEAVAKLLVAMSLFVFDGDRLLVYAMLTLLTRVLLNISIALYSRTYLRGCRYKYIWERARLKELTSFSGWSLLGATSFTFMTQGHSLLLNIFFGPIVNAAKGISDRIKGFSLMLSQNVFMAVTPQLIKSYASGNMDFSRKLVLVSSRLSFMLLFLVSIPVIMEMRPLLSLWLGEENVTNDTVSFSICCLIFVLITTLEAPLTKIVQATGEVKRYEIIVGAVTLSFIPVSFVSLYFGYSATSTFVIMNIIYMVIMIYRIRVASRILQLSYTEYFTGVIGPIFIVCLIEYILIRGLLYVGVEELVLFIRLVIWIVLTIGVSCALGLSKEEKGFLMNKLKSKIHGKE